MGSRHYSDSERETALKAVVLAEDNVAKATRDLQTAGFDIPRSTLREWIARDPERLEAIRIQYGPELEEKKARMAEKVATAAGEATLALVEQTMETKDDLSAKDVAGAARNMATVFGIATEKGLLHRQKPTSITAHDYSSAVKGLERMGLIEGTAEEIPDASSLPEGQPA